MPEDKRGAISTLNVAVCPIVPAVNELRLMTILSFVKSYEAPVPVTEPIMYELFDGIVSYK